MLLDFPKHFLQAGKKTSYLLAGSNPGPSKIDKAKQNQIKTINENEFLKLIYIPES